MLAYELHTDSVSWPSYGKGWLSLLRTIVDEGYVCNPRSLPTREVLALTYSLPLGRVEIREKGNPAIGVVEGVGIISGAPWYTVLSALTSVAPQTVASGMFSGSMSDYAGRLRGFPTYNLGGNRSLIDRQAIGILSRNEEYGTHLPCTTSVQFRERDGFLHVNVHMRSQDLFLGLPADTMMWTLVGLYVARQWGLMPGKLIFQVSAAHIYYKHVERVDEVVDEWEYMWQALILPTQLTLLESLPEAKGRSWKPSGLHCRRVIDATQ